jgi:hypothetical protein
MYRLVSKPRLVPCVSVAQKRFAKMYQSSSFTNESSSIPSLEELQKERQILLQEAGRLTRSLYRACMRSVRYIRQGNAHDEEEFKRREEEQRNTPKESLSLMAQMHPVDREDELASRGNYYAQYTHENFLAEMHLLKPNPWQST